MVGFPFPFDPTVHVEDTECSCGGVSYEDVQTLVAGEATARTTADTTLQTNITNEATTRATADTNLQTALTTETTARTTQDTAILTELRAEETARATAVSTEQTRATTKENAIETAFNALDDSMETFFPKLEWTEMFDGHKGQGYVFDGTYFYGAWSQDENTHATIYKYDVNGNLVATVESARAGHYNTAFLKGNNVYFGGYTNQYYYGFSTADLSYVETLDCLETYKSVTYDSERGLYYALENARNVLVCMDGNFHQIYKTPLINFLGRKFNPQGIFTIGKDMLAIAYMDDENAYGGGICLCGVDGICPITFQDEGTFKELQQVSIYNNYIYAVEYDYDNGVDKFWKAPLTISDYYAKFPTVNTNYMVNKFAVYHREIASATQFTNTQQEITFDTTQFPISYYKNVKVRLWRPEVHTAYEVTCPILIRDDTNAWCSRYHCDIRGTSSGSMDVIYLLITPSTTGLKFYFTSQLYMNISTGTFTSGTSLDSAPKLLDIWLER